HLAGNLLADGTLLVKVLELDQTGPGTDFNGSPIIAWDTGAGFHLRVNLGAELGGSTNRILWFFERDFHLTHIPVPRAALFEPAVVPGRALVHAGASVDRVGCHVTLVVVAEILWNCNLRAANLCPVALLVVAQYRDHEIHLFMGKDESFLREVVHLGLCLH